MMSKLTQKLDEVRRLHSIYNEHKDSPDKDVRRKAHVDLDRFLMENRETAILCMEQVLTDELNKLAAVKAHRILKPTLLQRLSYKLNQHATKKANKRGVPM